LKKLFLLLLILLSLISSNRTSSFLGPYVCERIAYFLGMSLLENFSKRKLFILIRRIMLKSCDLARPLLDFELKLGFLVVNWSDCSESYKNNA
jgi:hypothetical protein